jgi:hypothetical protein
MLRILAFVAILSLIGTTAFGVSAAQAVVCSYDQCVSNCHRSGGKHCLRGCDRRIARRQSLGLCEWHGLGDLSLNR